MRKLLHFLIGVLRMSRSPTVRFYAFVALGTLVACGHPESEPSPSNVFIGFLQPKLFLSSLGTPTPLPLAPGSASSRELYEIAPSGVVSLDAFGNLIALRNGDARIEVRGTTQSLSVSVRTAGALSLYPAQTSLKEGASVPVRATGDDGLLLDLDGVTWSTTQPATAFVEKGQITAGHRAGRAHIVATYAGKKAEAIVDVFASTGGVLGFRTAPERLTVGEVAHYRLTVPVQAVWTSSNSRILTMVSPSMVRARKRGQATICAAALSENVCVNVEVTR